MSGSTSSPSVADEESAHFSESGLPLRPYYRSADLPGPEEPPPGGFPFTRGVYPDMYRGRHWTMRQYSGFAIKLRLLCNCAFLGEGGRFV